MTTKELAIVGAKIGVAVAVGKLTYMVLDTIIKTIVFTITGVILAGESKYRKENEKVVKYPYSSRKAHEERMKEEKNHESDNNRS